MKNILKFIVFVIYTIIIFFIDNIIILGTLFAINCIIAFYLRLDYKKMFISLKTILPFIIFTMCINYIMDGLYSGIIIGIRMLICYKTTYIFSKTITVLELSDTIQKICTPLKFFKIEINNVGLMISISICMIPILKEEIVSIIKAVKSKGGKIDIRYLFIIMKPLLISIFKNTNQIEKTLIAKGYKEV